jgi:type IV pilus assembly protein PilC
MSNYTYVAVNPQGLETRGCIEVPDQTEALRRIKEMGLFPMKLMESRERRRQSRTPVSSNRVQTAFRGRPRRKGFSLFNRVSAPALVVFTRQLATLVEAGMPLVRSLRTLREQEERRGMQRILESLSQSIEDGCSLSEAVGRHPRVFNALYLNMVRAGEIGGALEVTLGRLAEFMEKAQKIRGKVKAAMFYPCAVLFVALIVLGVLTVFVVPRFRLVFDGLLGRASMPQLTLWVFDGCDFIRAHALTMLVAAGVVGGGFSLLLRTSGGQWVWDRLKLWLPVVGPLFRKIAISRFSRTLGTLVSNGVPILQALTIVKDTSGNQVFARLIERVHTTVKEGDPIAPALKSSSLFPAMVAGMVDVGEQTGTLPEMLMKVADNYDEEVDNATSALTSLLEPIMILFLAVVVGGIVIAMFWPLIRIMEGGMDSTGQPGGD